MVENNNSRRGFIRGMAVLSAALLADSPAALFASTTQRTGLPEKWRIFWQLQGGTEQILQQPIEDAAIRTICNGHEFKLGAIVEFANEKMLAQPIWIYWGQQRSKPDDVIISFFTQEEKPDKICRINRYELETLHHFVKEDKAQNLVALCKANSIHSKPNNETNKSLFVKSIIRKKQPAKIMTAYRNHHTILEKEIIYNV